MAKSLEELMGVFQGFPDAFKDRFGRKVSKSEIISIIENRIKALELQQLKTIFDSYEPKALKAALEQIKTDTSQWESIVDDLKKNDLITKQPINVTNDNLSNEYKPNTEDIGIIDGRTKKNKKWFNK